MKLKTAKARILKVNNNLKATSGIYIFWRTNLETGKRVCYIGQSNNILRRCAEHLLGYQKIDLSIKKHGLYDPTKNKGGYWVQALKYCDTKLLDELEKKYIRIYSEKPYVELKNITSGGQDAGRTNIAEARPAKKYNDGLKQGYANCKKEVKEFFNKYLDFKCKSDYECYKKADKTGHRYLKKIYTDKYAEFKEWLEK